MTIVFDIVIPAHKKDLKTLKYCVKYARKNIIGARNIYVVSKENYDENSIFFDEKNFPFSYQEISNILTNSNVGWHYQQLLKLYAPLVIQGISENVMILDSDTVFFKKTKMFDEKNRAYFNLSKDENINSKSFDLAVDSHIEKLLPEISRKNIPEEFQKVSSIAHNMIFNREILKELFQKVETRFEGKKFYEIFLSLSDKTHGVSEYQTYFNYISIFHPEKFVIRKLKYKNTSDFNILKYDLRKKYDYCSFHSHLRSEKPSFFEKIFSKFRFYLKF